MVISLRIKCSTEDKKKIRDKRGVVSIGDFFSFYSLYGIKRETAFPTIRLYKEDDLPEKSLIIPTQEEFRKFRKLRESWRSSQWWVKAIGKSRTSVYDADIAVDPL